MTDNQKHDPDKDGSCKGRSITRRNILTEAKDKEMWQNIKTSGCFSYLTQPFMEMKPQKDDICKVILVHLTTLSTAQTTQQWKCC
jgi:hypothetical protein